MHWRRASDRHELTLAFSMIWNVSIQLGQVIDEDQTAKI
jgi:hypothetical protein